MVVNVGKAENYFHVYDCNLQLPFIKDYIYWWKITLFCDQNKQSILRLGIFSCFRYDLIAASAKLCSWPFYFKESETVINLGWHKEWQHYEKSANVRTESQGACKVLYSMTDMILWWFDWENLSKIHLPTLCGRKENTIKSLSSATNPQNSSACCI